MGKFRYKYNKSRWEVEWWNTHIEKPRKKNRAMCKRSKKTWLPLDCDIYKMVQNKYKKYIRTYKQNDCRGFYKELKDVLETPRLHKIIEDGIDSETLKGALHGC